MFLSWSNRLSSAPGLQAANSHQRVVAQAAAAVVAGLLVGCAPKSQMTATSDSPESSPLVISGTPRSDTAAFGNANRSLLQAQAGVIDEMGPHPIWRSAPNKRDKILSGATDRGDPEQRVPQRSSSETKSLHVDASQLHDSQDSFAIPYLEAADLPGPTQVADASPPPANASAAPAFDGPLAPQFLAVQPSDAAETRPSAPRPVTKQTLPDGRVRLIWHLRSFGGPRVTTAAPPPSPIPNAAVQRRNVTLTPADLAPLLAVLSGHLADKGTVLPLPNESKLVITCTAEAEEGVLSLLDDLDVPAPQVEITAKIFEVSHNFDYQQGAKVLLNRIAEDGSQQALSAFQTQRLLDSVANAAPFQGSVVSLMQTFADAGVSLDAQFELLAEAGLIHVVSSPRLTVAEGQTGYMLAGQELPIQSVNIVNNVLQTATTYKPVGVQLYITPQAIGGGMVKLHTVSIVSSVAGFSPLPSIRGLQQDNFMMNPIIDSREAETAVTVPEGETLVISGMRMVRTTTREDKVPGLGDLPLIGNLFKSHRSQQHLTDLYFFVTPTLASAAE